MSSRPFISPELVIVNGDMSLTALHSKPFIIKMMSLVNYQCSWTGTPTGTFTVETSEDYTQNSDGSVKNAGTWDALPLSSVPAASGSSGHGTVNLQGIGAYAIRLSYTKASGTGTLNVTASAKVA